MIVEILMSVLGSRMYGLLGRKGIVWKSLLCGMLRGELSKWVTLAGRKLEN